MRTRSPAVALATWMRPPGRRVAKRVGDEIREGPGELGLVTVQHHVGGERARDLHLLFLGLDREERTDAFDEPCDVDPLAAHGDRHGTDAGDVEELLGHLLQPQDVLVGGVEESLLLGRDAVRVPPEQLDRHAERGERRAELVRQRGDEVFAPAFLVAEIGHVLQRQDETRRRAVAGVPARRAQHVVVIASAQEEGDLHAIALALGVREDLTDGLAEPQIVGMGRGQVVEAGVQHLAPLDLEDRAGHLVHVLDRPAGVEDDQSVLARFENRLGLRLLLEDDVDPGAFDGDRHLVGERVEELALVERQALGRRSEAEDAHHAAGGFDWHVHPFAAREGLRSSARRLVVVPDPRRRCQLGVAEYGARRRRRADPEMPRRPASARRRGTRRGRPGDARRSAGDRRARRRPRSGARTRRARRCAARGGARARPVPGRAQSADSSRSPP